MVLGNPSLDMSPRITPSLPTELLKARIKKKVLASRRKSSSFVFRSQFEDLYLIALLQHAERLGGSPVVLPRCLIVTWGGVGDCQNMIRDGLLALLIIVKTHLHKNSCSKKILVFTSQCPHTEETIGKRVLPRRPENAMPRYLKRIFC